MKFLIDENESAGLVDPLRMILPMHEFVHVSEFRLQGTPDVPLIYFAKDEAIDAILTRDQQMLINEDERQALIDTGIHWVGRKTPKRLTGAESLSAGVATYVAALPHVARTLTDATCALYMYVKNIETDMNQRITKCAPVDSYGKR